MEALALFVLTVTVWALTAGALVIELTRRLAGARPGNEDVGLWMTLAACWLLYAFRG